MFKLIKTDSTVVVILNDGTSIQRSNITPSEWDILQKSNSEEEILSIMNPEYEKQVEEAKTAKKIIDSTMNSKYLSMKDDLVYWEEISHLSMPKELVEAVLKAEQEGDELRLETYRNFWTLMSLNPDEQCRKNLFWFLNRNGLVISRCGFFVAYRNVEKTAKEGVFTDNYSHKFTIEIGKMVTMDRSECDSNQNKTCSKGLHLGARTWLKSHYCGNVGLVCLCNPAEVVAVPHEDYYGKLRTCAYLPIDFAEFDKNGDVIPYNVENGFECEYVPHVIYEGLMGTEEDSDYRIVIPEIEGINKQVISDKLLDLARECITHRVV